VTTAAKHAAEFLLELGNVWSLDQLFLVAAFRNDFREVRNHPHAESADRSHRFVSLLMRSLNITNQLKRETNGNWYGAERTIFLNLNLCSQFIQRSRD
jgi:hypothetical protein